MRIGIDIGKALGPLDGLARYARELVRGLVAVDRENRYILFPLFAEAAEGDPEARAREVFGELPPNFSLARRRAPLAGEVEVFHCTTASVPHGEPAPLVYTLYDLTFLTHPEAHTLDNRLHCLRGLCRALAREARLVAISRCTRRDAAQLLDLPEAAIDVVYPAADPRFRPRDGEEVEAVRRRHGLEAPYVFTLGTLEPRKNLAALVAAFGLLPERLRREWQLAAAGGAGWGTPDLEVLAAAAGVGDRVRWLGRVPDDELPALYSGAELFAYPSLYEGFGLPPLEAMACGTPVLASRAASLPEVVGEAALLVDPESPEAVRDGLASLMGDPELRRALAAAGGSRAAELSWEETARRTLAVYRAVAEAAGLAADTAPGSGEGAA